MKLKRLYLDLETTGVDHNVNGVCQIAGIVEINGKVQKTFNFHVRPFEKDIIEDEALEVIKKTREEIEQYNDPDIVHKALLKIFDQYIDKYNRSDKFELAGYNVKFDDDFLRSWFFKLGDKYYGSYVNPYKVDLYSVLAWLRGYGLVTTENLKLETVAKYFSIEHDAHDAMGDVKATREISVKCQKFLKR